MWTRLRKRMIDSGRIYLASRPLPMPAFGQADLSNCEREQIQLPGSIQPHGALLVVREPDHFVIQQAPTPPSFLTLTARSLE